MSTILPEPLSLLQKVNALVAFRAWMEEQIDASPKDGLPVYPDVSTIPEGSPARLVDRRMWKTDLEPGYEARGFACRSMDWPQMRLAYREVPADHTRTC